MLLGGSIEGSMEYHDDGSKDIEYSELNSPDDMCGRNKYSNFEVFSLVESL